MARAMNIDHFWVVNDPTPADVQNHYQCDECADRDEGGLAKLLECGSGSEVLEGLRALSDAMTLGAVTPYEVARLETEVKP